MRSGVWFLAIVVVAGGWWLLGGEDAPPELEHRKDLAQDDVVPELRGADGMPEPRPEPPPVKPELAGASAADAPDPTHYVIEGRIEMADENLRIPVGEVTADAAHTFVRAGRLNSESKIWRATPDRAGRFTLRVEGAPPHPVTRFQFEGGLARVRSWSVDGAADPDRLDTSPGAVNEVVLTLVATFRLKGVVRGSRGTPMPGATVSWGTLHPVGQGSMTVNVQRIKTDAAGRFDVGPFDLDPSLVSPPIKPFMDLSVEIPEHPLVRVDPWKVPADERDRVEVVVDEGALLEGVLLDPDGQPLPGVVLALEYGGDWKRRKATRTDERGLWRLDRVARGKTRIQALAAAHGCKVDQSFVVGEDDRNVELVATPLPMPDPGSIRRVAGWGLAELTEEQRKAWMLPDDVKVLILEVPDDHARFGIGTVEPGNGLLFIGNQRVTSIRDAVTRLLAMTEPKGGAHRRTIPTARIVYTFRAERMRGTNTQHMRLTSQDRAALEALAAELKKR